MLLWYDLKAYAHIDSNIKIWKKSYNVGFVMLNTSDFGWNNRRKYMEVDNEILAI